VNHRLVRDRLVLHALSEAYRNIIPPTSFPVVLVFLEMPPEEVDVNVHPAKTEVRFRQPAFVHDFIRDSVRTTLMNARPAANFASALTAAPRASASLLVDVSPMPGPPDQPVFSPRPLPDSEAGPLAADAESFTLRSQSVPAAAARLDFADAAIAVGYDSPATAAEDATAEGETETATLNALATLKPLGQLRDSFILAMNEEGL